MITNTLPPSLDTVEPWAEPLIRQALEERGLNAADYRRQVRGDEARYVVLLMHIGSNPSARGSSGGAPSWEITIDRRTRTLSGMQAVR